MNRKVLALSLLIAFFMGVISICPCPAMAFSGKRGPHGCCDKAGKCPSKDCQTSGMTSLLSISEKISHEVSPSAPVIIKAVSKAQDQSKPVEITRTPPDLLLHIPSPDIPIVFSTLLI